jgi:hypothetical protein
MLAVALGGNQGEADASKSRAMWVAAAGDVLLEAAHAQRCQHLMARCAAGVQHCMRRAAAALLVHACHCLS